MKGMRGTEPDGAMGDAFWILAYHDGEMTTAQVHACHVDLIASLGDPDYHPLTRSQIRRGLAGLLCLQPPLAASDTPGRGRQAHYRATRHGLRMARIWDGGPERELCGLGWPAQPATML